MQGVQRRGGLVGPLLLIAFGVIFLLNNLGMLGWGVWEMILRLWPVLLVAAGLDLLFGRRSVLGSILVVVIVLGIVGGALWYFELQPAAGGEALAAQEIYQPLDGASRADVEIGFGVGTLRLGARPESPNLLEGTVPTLAGERVSKDFYVTGDTAYLRLRSRSDGGFPFEGRWGTDRVWDLKLNGTVPTRLRVNTGVGVTSADLGQMSLSDLEVHGGVGKTDLILPGRGQYQVRINGGVGEVNVMIPAGMAARIRVDAGLGGIQVNGNYQRQDRYYVSPGYDSAQNRVDLRVNGGVGRISVQEYSSQQALLAPPSRPSAVWFD